MYDSASPRSPASNDGSASSVLGMAVYGVRMLAPFYARDDLLYHWGLTNTILVARSRQTGRTSDCPPTTHRASTSCSRPSRACSGSTRRPPPRCSGCLASVIPFGSYLLTRRLTGRRDVALVAAVLTAFAGGFDLSADRLWVNSMFMVGQSFVPAYPRDLVFGLLPFAVLAFLRATDHDRRPLTSAVLAGVLLGLCGLIQIQLLLPIPGTLAFVVVVLGLRHRRRGGPYLPPWS